MKSKIRSEIEAVCVYCLLILVFISLIRFVQKCNGDVYLSKTVPVELERIANSFDKRTSILSATQNPKPLAIKWVDIPILVCENNACHISGHKTLRIGLRSDGVLVWLGNVPANFHVVRRK